MQQLNEIEELYKKEVDLIKDLNIKLSTRNDYLKQQLLEINLDKKKQLSSNNDQISKLEEKEIYCDNLNRKLKDHQKIKKELTGIQDRNQEITKENSKIKTQLDLQRMEIIKLESFESYGAPKGLKTNKKGNSDRIIDKFRYGDAQQSPQSMEVKIVKEEITDVTQPKISDLKKSDQKRNKSGGPEIQLESDPIIHIASSVESHELDAPKIDMPKKKGNKRSLLQPKTIFQNDEEKGEFDQKGMNDTEIPIDESKAAIENPILGRRSTDGIFFNNKTNRFKNFGNFTAWCR